jgi:hypothetical protein
MAYVGLTRRPTVPVLVRATAIGAIAIGSIACADDGGGDDGSNTSANTTDDVFPTAGPCAHDPEAPGCGSSGSDGMTAGEASGTDPTLDGADDQHPTIPCIHDPGACATSTGAGDDGGASTESDDGSSTGDAGDASSSGETGSSSDGGG